MDDGTIKEDYISFETAKLLKEKGFPQKYDIYHSMVYNEEDYEDEYEVQRMVVETRIVKAGTLSSYPVGVPEPKCYCPTLQMVMKWLGEVHNLHIDIFVTWRDKITHYQWSIDNLITQDTICETPCLEKYEEACEAAIKYCLNLI